MTRRIAMFLILSLVIMIPLSSFADDNFDQHFTLSMLMGAIGETVVHNRETLNVPMKILVGAAIGTVPGIIKEIGDSTNDNNYFSETQVLYDAMGSAVGSLIAYKYHSRTKVNVSGSEGGVKISLLYSY
jgi:hypothetical protein